MKHDYSTVALKEPELGLVRAVAALSSMPIRDVIAFLLSQADVTAPADLRLDPRFAEWLRARRAKA